MAAQRCHQQAFGEPEAQRLCTSLEPCMTFSLSPVIPRSSYYLYALKPSKPQFSLPPPPALPNPELQVQPRDWPEGSSLPVTLPCVASGTGLRTTKRLFDSRNSETPGEAVPATCNCFAVAAGETSPISCSESCSSLPLPPAIRPAVCFGWNYLHPSFTAQSLQLSAHEASCRIN